ncbi:hypothetical protein THRCLA_02217 [Thraustotheca clavata]|uniref:Mediator complex subunit 15 KIX domain-containing protein n=1 Tax=Thraustotheca clavata TaxID=74557 RepID=A0A1W0A634_9STRA|nr:hypothetical protein THRCLA_02217 [Thraustotheca clavata]
MVVALPTRVDPLSLDQLHEDVGFDLSASTSRTVAQHRQHYVRMLCREVLKVHTMLHAPFDRRTVIDTCKSVEESIYNANIENTEAYIRQMRTRVQLIAKKGCALVRQTCEEENPTAPTTQVTQTTPIPVPSEEMTVNFQQAHIQQAICSAWIKSQRKRARFRWAQTNENKDNAYVNEVMNNARADILQSIRVLYTEPLVLYEEQLRKSLARQHRDWVAYDLSVVQELLEAIRPGSLTLANVDIATLHVQIQKLLKEKALFDYMWAMEQSTCST